MLPHAYGRTLYALSGWVWWQGRGGMLTHAFRRTLPALSGWVWWWGNLHNSLVDEGDDTLTICMQLIIMYIRA